MLTPSALKSKACRLGGTLWRVVEAQHISSTLRLTDTLDDQAVLEDVLEATKPPYPPGAEQLHYLLKTPFRYGAPYPHGSRFRRAHSTHGVFYGSEAINTALAETAFYRLLFFSASPDTPAPKRPVAHSVFSITYQTERGLNLVDGPLRRYRKRWLDSVSYAATQALADSAIDAALTAIRYTSVRDPECGANVALLSPEVFTRRKPSHFQTWYSLIKPSAVNFWRDHETQRLAFQREIFEDQGHLVGPE